jgi:hypothetical protein
MKCCTRACPPVNDDRCEHAHMPANPAPKRRLGSTGSLGACVIGRELRRRPAANPRELPPHWRVVRRPCEAQLSRTPAPGPDGRRTPRRPMGCADALPHLRSRSFSNSRPRQIRERAHAGSIGRVARASRLGRAPVARVLGTALRRPGGAGHSLGGRPRAALGLSAGFQARMQRFGQAYHIGCLRRLV